MNAARPASLARSRSFIPPVVVVAGAFVAAIASPATAAEVAQGTFLASLTPGAGCSHDGVPTLLGYTSVFQFDDKTFHINMAPGNNQLVLNFSQLGVFHAEGEIMCTFDEGGTFNGSAVNEAGDFRWLDFDGEYLDRVPGIGEGDPFPWVAGARCETTRTDDFKTFCDNFELSWNGLSKAQAPNPGYNDFGGDLNVRTVQRMSVAPDASGDPVVAATDVDGAGGDVPDVRISFANGVASAGEISVVTLADAHGELAPGTSLPTRGTTEIDHGYGPVPFFEGGDERFIDIRTDAALPMGPKIEVCLPMPEIASAADVRPVRVLHGEGGDYASRKFVDRTSHIDHADGKVCASVSSFSKFAVVTSDVCGGGKPGSDGIVTVAGGLVGRKNVVVDGLTDCADFPSDLSPKLASLCVPDADNVDGQCSVALTLGVDRAACNHVDDGVDASASDVNVYSYIGSIRGKTSTVDLNAVFRDMLYALPSRTEATVGPVAVALPASGPVTKYKLRQRMDGAEPGSLEYTTDKDAATITCIVP